MKKVITYGTFDLFHKGHYNILKRARALGDYLIVGVTGESYDMERGKLSVVDSLVTRIENVRSTGFADKIIVEEYLGQKIHDVIEYDIDILVVGSDWKGKFDHLKRYCDVIYLERTKDISSTLLRKENNHIFKFGIVTESKYDNDAVFESKYVSGIHAESVFCDDISIAKEFSELYELDKYTDDYEEFLNDVEIIYIKTNRRSRYDYIKKALSKGKHVISEPIITLERKYFEELMDIAKNNNVILIENIPTLYLQAFNQLLWNAKGNLIGDLISIKYSINKNNIVEKESADLYDCLALPIYIATKLLGLDYNLDINCIEDSNGEILYVVLVNKDSSNIALIIEIGMKIDIDNRMVLLGTKGRIEVPGDWWRTGYFKMKIEGDDDYKRYCSNFEGNGFRYIIQSLLSAIRKGKVSSTRLLIEEQLKTIEVLNDLIKRR